MECKEQNDNSVEVRITANPVNLSQVRSVIEEATSQAGLSEHDADGVILAVDEAITNSIRHGYGGVCEKPIILKAYNITDGSGSIEALVIEIRDFGKQVDPKTIKSRDLDDVRPGGLGVHIIHSTMDEVEYSCPQENGGMKLRMVKYLGTHAKKDSKMPTTLPKGQSPGTD